MKRIVSTILVLSLVSLSLALGVNTPASAAPGYLPPPLKVAVVRSQASQDWVNLYGRGYGILEKEDRLYEYLLSRNWDVERIYDADLENLSKLQEYDVVVCMWVFAMSTRAANTLRDYVAQGGGVSTLYASPRVAPGEGGSERDDHWVYLMNYEGWEWGPMSEVNQTYFIDDVGAMALEAKPVWGHPIISQAATILNARGYSATDLTLYRDSTPGTWVELPSMLAGNTNTSQFMTMSQQSVPSASYSYPGTHPGAVASEYLNGRMSYFYFSPTDFLPTMNMDGSAFYTRPNGVMQGEIAGALIESSIIWAAGAGTSPGVLNRDGRTYATLDVYQDGIYASQYVYNEGNVSVTGTLSMKIYNPSGQLVYNSTRYKVGVQPGASGRYSHQYRPGRLLDGYYRVETSYVTTYPEYLRTYTETRYVKRGAGVGLRTSYDAVRSGGRYVFDPRIERFAGIDRYATALAIADEAGGYPREGGYVIVASGDGGADALVASSLAGAYDAPLVLTRPGSVPASVDAWLSDPAKGFDKAIIVGGTGAVSADVEIRLKQIFGAEEGEVIRLAGLSRYDTAAVVARNVRERLGDTYDGGIIVANGQALVDAAGASAVAAGLKRPILYVEATRIQDFTAAAISDITSASATPVAWVAGGTGVVQELVVGQLAEIVPGITVERAAGIDRYETAAKLCDLATSAGAEWTVVGMASGVSLADALCLGSMIGRSNGVMILTNGSGLTVPTSDRLKAHSAEISMIAIGGGTGVVTDAATLAASNCLP